MDFAYMEGTPCLHIIDHSKIFSVVPILPSLSMNVQINTFNTDWRAVFGTCMTIKAKKEYNSEDLFKFCKAVGIKLKSRRLKPMTCRENLREPMGY